MSRDRGRQTSLRGTQTANPKHLTRGGGRGRAPVAATRLIASNFFTRDSGLANYESTIVTCKELYQMHRKTAT